MWIRSQDKTMLLDVNHIIINHYEKGTPPHYDIETFQSGYGWNRLGKYSTKEKALKVMDMIQKTIIQNETVYAHEFSGSGVRDYDIFQMPTDMEV